MQVSSGGEIICPNPVVQSTGNPYVANKEIATRYLARSDVSCLRRCEYGRTGCRSLGGSHTSTCTISADRVTYGKPHVRRERRVFDAHLVLDGRDLLFRDGRMVRHRCDFRQSAYRSAHRERHLLSYLYRRWRKYERFCHSRRFGHAPAAPGSHGVPCGEPQLRREWGVFHAHLVVNQCYLLLCFQQPCFQRVVRQQGAFRQHRPVYRCVDNY